MRGVEYRQHRGDMFRDRDEMRVLSGVVYRTKRRGPRTEPWEHQKSRYERLRKTFFSHLT